MLEVVENDILVTFVRLLCFNLNFNKYMSKHLTLFDTLEDYNRAKSSLILPNASYIQSTKQAIYLKESKSDPLDGFLSYLHYDGTIDYIAAPDVIGICVIPKSHYGKARYMSVTANPAGTRLVWNTEANDFQPYTNNPHSYIICNFFENLKNFDINNYLTGYFTFLPTDILSTDDILDESLFRTLDVSNTNLDPIAIKYRSVYEEDNFFTQSPFLKDGSLNPMYCFNDCDNALNDVNGFENTQRLANDSKFHAAQSCINFYPGYKNGEWYLPAIGELGYLWVRWRAINVALEKLYNAGCNINYLNYGGEDFWSSTETYYANAWYLSFYGGCIAVKNKKNSWCDIRPFLLVD